MGDQADGRIIAELRAIREAYAARFDYDVEGDVQGHSSQTEGLRARIRAPAGAPYDWRQKPSKTSTRMEAHR